MSYGDYIPFVSFFLIVFHLDFRDSAASHYPDLILVALLEMQLPSFLEGGWV